MRKFFCSIFLVCCGCIVFGQDIHFTNFMQSQVYSNPAAYGTHDGRFRLAMNYKDQWSSIGKGYKTMGAALDASFYRAEAEKFFIGAGLMMYQDEAGTANFKTSAIGGGGSVILMLNPHMTASVGTSVLYNRLSFNLGQITTDRQFNGMDYDGSLYTGESILSESAYFVDFAVGGQWVYTQSSTTLSSKDGISLRAGFAYHHLTLPFTLLGTANVSDKLYSRWIIPVDAKIGIKNTNIFFRPRLQFQIQGPSKELISGLLIHYILNQESVYTGNVKEVGIAIGGYYRAGDAFSPTFELHISDYTVGVAYDMNLSGLRNSTQGNGGLEFFVNVKPALFKFGKGSKVDPRFF